MNLPLANQVALVTGSAKRIGKSIALALAARGADIIVHARTSRTEAEQTAEAVRVLGRRAAVALGDVALPEAVEAMMAEAAGAFGRLDILVNNAAIRRAVPLEELDYAEWRAVTGTILDGAFLCSRAALPHLKASGSGRIINIGGVTSHIGADSRAHVVAAKAGIVGLTKALAVELGPYGIRVNCVAPGLIEDQGDEAAHSAFRRRHTPPEKIPLRRIGNPDDIAQAVAGLCCPEFAYVTGQTIHVNGGVFLW